MKDRGKPRSGDREPRGPASRDRDYPSAPEARASRSELALVERLRAGDERALADLIGRYHGRLLRLALVFASSRAAAEEVVLEAWTGLLEGLAHFGGRSTLETWILRILTDRARSRGFREQRVVSFSSPSEVEPNRECPVHGAQFQRNGWWAVSPRRWEADAAEKLVMNEEALHELERAVAELPLNQRAVVTLRDIDGLDSNAVRDVLGISESNQHLLLHQARSTLRGALQAFVERK